ncbi:MULTISPECIES: carbohydrate ABC transporter permease [Paenibacillus]|uniref:Sugar ABC transporter permease n=3 Tax=Paenibacillus TaxID=44249 RepID=A0ABU3REU0_9BACL|nr:MULTISPECIES: sugar ABC transporter permease [Paenibacillus]MBA2942996.1 sugar ABC transporter permease [Paenibacillus sp. CGMCC 1.16610]MCY9657681.1 sugar ABC transporter permease [Paenibacillus anseongense]MDU0202802.1 sugar ABC transporter permease [Paenibacillus sp. PFR10]MEB4794975.1 sugar ABC transporter permease [Paenibacillus chondroitinus]MEC0271146.1 sugar ABC transporter permease [Paenibacillus anseongense]
MDKVMSNKSMIALYVIPSLLLVVALIYMPIVMTGYYGLMKWDGVGKMSFIGLQNYMELLRDELFWSSAKHSFLLAIFSALSLLVYLLVALVLSANLRGANLFRKVYLIPMLLSSVAIAQLWLKIFHPTNGMLNHILTSLGVQHTPEWLSNPSIVLYAIFIPILWQYAGFYILIYYAALKNVPSSLIESARIDGASPWRIALSIRIPLIAEVMKVTVVLAVVGSLKYFDLIYVMTGGGPNGASEVMASYMYRKAFKGYDFGYASAIGFFLLIICLVVTWLIRKATASKDNIQYS